MFSLEKKVLEEMLYQLWPILWQCESNKLNVFHYILQDYELWKHKVRYLDTRNELFFLSWR